MQVLRNPSNTVFAVNCDLRDSGLFCGALYLEPKQKHSVIRLSDNSAMLDVSLPPELLNQASASRAWDVELPVVKNHEQVQPPIRS